MAETAEHTETADQDAGWCVASACIAGPALVALIPMAAAASLIAMARRFAAGEDSQLFSQTVMTLPAAMLILSAPAAGWLAGRVSQRAVLAGSLILYVVGGAGVLFIDSRNSLILLRLLLGLAGGGVLTASLGLIGDHFSGHRREHILGYATAMASVFATLALIFGGRLVDAGGWRAPFALYLLGVPALILVVLAIRKGSPAATSAAGGTIHALRHVWAYLAFLILLTLGMFTPSIETSFVLHAKGIGSSQTIGEVVSATSFIAIFSAAAFGFLRRFLSLHGCLVLDALSMGTGILTIGLAGQVWHILSGCALVGIGAGMSEATIASLIFGRTPPAAHAMAMGLIVSALNVGQFINPLVFAPLRHGLGPSGAFVAVGLFILLVATVTALRHANDLVEKG